MVHSATMTKAHQHEQRLHDQIQNAIGQTMVLTMSSQSLGNLNTIQATSPAAKISRIDRLTPDVTTPGRSTTRKRDCEISARAHFEEFHKIVRARNLPIFYQAR
jgi:hypothetical protein